MSNEHFDPEQRARLRFCESALILMPLLTDTTASLASRITAMRPRGRVTCEQSGQLHAHDQMRSCCIDQRKSMLGHSLLDHHEREQKRLPFAD